MKKSDAIDILVDILKEWDGCLIDKKAARSILNKIEKRIGMLSPDRLAHLPAPCEMIFEWDTKRTSK
jgi:hypothetical protein